MFLANGDNLITLASDWFRNLGPSLSVYGILLVVTYWLENDHVTDFEPMRRVECYKLLGKLFLTGWLTGAPFLSLRLSWRDAMSGLQQLPHFQPEEGADAQRRAEARESPRKETGPNNKLAPSSRAVS